MKTEELKNIIVYNPSTGSLRCTTARGKLRVGDYIGSAHSKGYLETAINGRSYFLHRLAWQIFYGDEPDGQIDHINGNRADNRICNLRLANQQQNSANMRRRPNNKSGKKGVYFHTKNKKWISNITVDGKCKYLGSFNDKDEAHRAYVAAASSAFGSFARAD